VQGTATVQGKFGGVPYFNAVPANGVTASTAVTEANLNDAI
jgi:hypothetical protein